jgi:hypothetical protein
LLSRLGSRKIRFFIAKINTGDLVFLKNLLEAGLIAPIIDRRYSLSETADALRYREAGHAKGKVVIAIEHTDELQGTVTLRAALTSTNRWRASYSLAAVAVVSLVLVPLDLACAILTIESVNPDYCDLDLWTRPGSPCRASLVQTSRSTILVKLGVSVFRESAHPDNRHPD